MGLYSPPPTQRTFREDKPTLLVCWWCTLFAGTIILFRVCGRYIRSEKLFREDWIALACMIPLYARMACVHIVLLWGTNNVVVDGLMTDLEKRHRVIGSRAVLASRIFYAATLWMLKLTITEFFKRLIPLQIWRPSYERIFQLIRCFLLLTFIATFVSDLAECMPVTHYWLVSPTTPPQCRQGFAQLLTMGVSNIITDLLLVVFPIPVIVTSSTMSMKRKFQLTSLFALSLVPVIVTAYRIPNIISKHGSQQYRSLWASIEILFATAVANALVLGSFVRDRGVKKLKYKIGSFQNDSMERTSSRRPTVVRHWGSDEDLVRDLGMSVDPDLREDEAPNPRPAPMANGLARDGPGSEHVHAVNQAWRFPRSGSDTSSAAGVDEPRSPGEVSSLTTNTPRKVSFFDVGGLLDSPTLTTGSTSPMLTRKGSSSTSRDLAREVNNGTAGQGAGGGMSGWAPGNGAVPPKKGSATLLQDIGGLLTSSPRDRIRKESSVIEMQSLPETPERPQRKKSTPGELQDVGGLLR